MPVRAAFHWTEDEYRRVVRHHIRTTIRPSIRYLVGAGYLLAFALGVFVGVWSVLRPKPGETPGLAIGMSLFFLFLAMHTVFEENISLHFGVPRFRTEKEANMLVQWEFDTDRLYQTTDIAQRTDFPWDTIFQVLEVNDGFLIRGRMPIGWIPFSAFEQEEGQQQFRELARQNKVPFQRRRV